MEKNEIDSYGLFSNTQDTQEQSTGVYGMGDFVNLASLSDAQSTSQELYPQMELLKNIQGEYLQ